MFSAGAVNIIRYQLEVKLFRRFWRHHMEFVIRVSCSQVSSPPLGKVERFKGLMNLQNTQ